MAPAKPQIDKKMSHLAAFHVIPSYISSRVHATLYPTVCRYSVHRSVHHR